MTICLILARTVSFFKPCPGCPDFFWQNCAFVPKLVSWQEQTGQMPSFAQKVGCNFSRVQRNMCVGVSSNASPSQEGGLGRAAQARPALHRWVAEGLGLAPHTWERGKPWVGPTREGRRCLRLAPYGVPFSLWKIWLPYIKLARAGACLRKGWDDRGWFPGFMGASRGQTNHPDFRMLLQIPNCFSGIFAIQMGEFCCCYVFVTWYCCNQMSCSNAV